MPPAARLVSQNPARPVSSQASGPPRRSSSRRAHIERRLKRHTKTRPPPTALGSTGRAGRRRAPGPAGLDTEPSRRDRRRLHTKQRRAAAGRRRAASLAQASRYSDAPTSPSPGTLASDTTTSSPALRTMANRETASFPRETRQTLKIMKQALRQCHRDDAVEASKRTPSSRRAPRSAASAFRPLPKGLREPPGKVRARRDLEDVEGRDAVRRRPSSPGSELIRRR